MCYILLIKWYVAPGEESGLVQIRTFMVLFYAQLHYANTMWSKFRQNFS